MRRSWSEVFVLVIGVFLLGLPCVSQSQLVLYDDFNGPEINPQKWHGSEGDTGPSAPNAEAVRQITRGKLRLFFTRYGETASDSGTIGQGILRLRINNPTPVTALQVQVIVKQALTEDCPANPTASFAYAGIVGAFFNDGSSQGPGDRTGDIRGEFFKRRESAGGDRIRANVSRCANPGCSSNPSLVSHDFTTAWAIGGADTLRLQWDPDNNRFLFAVNPGTTREETAVLTYSVPDVDPPDFNHKELRLRNSAANCTAGQKKSSIDARFDKVMLNSEAVP